MKTANTPLSLLAIAVIAYAGYLPSALNEVRSAGTCIEEHYPGEDCLACHLDLRVGGTVYADSTAVYPLPDVSLAFITPEGEIVGSDASDADGNIWSYTLPYGLYLIQLGAISSRTWHSFPWQSSCNACHSPWYEETLDGAVRLPDRHTRLPVDNDCRHCHYPANTYAPDLVSTSGVLNAARLPRPIPPTTVTILGRSFTVDPSRYRLESVRPDVFTRGFFSLFDVILAVAERNGIAIAHEYDEAARTHWITSIDGTAGEYWYRWAFGAPGSVAGSADGPDLSHWRTDRWDENLWRPGVTIRVVADDGVSELRQAYREEIRREETSGHVVGVVTIADRRFTEVAVTPHRLRAPGYPSPFTKPFQPGVVTALDVLLSLRDRGELDPVQPVFVDRFAGSWMYGYLIPALGFGGTGTDQSPGLPGFTSLTYPGRIAGTPDEPYADPDGPVPVPPDLQVIHAPALSRWQMTAWPITPDQSP